MKKARPEDEEVLLPILAGYYTLEKMKEEAYRRIPDLRDYLRPGPLPQFTGMTSPQIEIAMDLLVVNSCRPDPDFDSRWQKMMDRLKARSPSDWRKGKGLENKKEVNDLGPNETDQFLDGLERKALQALGPEVQSTMVPPMLPE